MTLTEILIILSCLSAIVGAIVVVVASNPVRNLLGLFVTSISIGVLFLLLGGALVAMAQIIIYAGAVLMLFLFVVRFFSKKLKPSKLNLQLPMSIVVIFALALQLILPLLAWMKRGNFSDDLLMPEPIMIGQTIFERYVYPFELVTILLMVSIVGVIFIARKDHDGGDAR